VIVLLCVVAFVLLLCALGVTGKAEKRENLRPVVIGLFVAAGLCALAAVAIWWWM
jgi:glycerol uptake facilitator-like aquaporin